MNKWLIVELQLATNPPNIICHWSMYSTIKYFDNPSYFQLIHSPKTSGTRRLCLSLYRLTVSYVGYWWIKVGDCVKVREMSCCEFRWHVGLCKMEPCGIWRREETAAEIARKRAVWRNYGCVERSWAEGASLSSPDESFWCGGSALSVLMNNCRDGDGRLIARMFIGLMPMNLHPDQCIILTLIGALSCTISFQATYDIVVVGCICIFGVFDWGVDWFKISSLVQSICSLEGTQNTAHRDKNCGKSHFQLPGKTPNC